MAAIITAVGPEDQVALTLFIPNHPFSWRSNIPFSVHLTEGHWSYPPILVPAGEVKP
jgi:hypothetical protein